MKLLLTSNGLSHPKIVQALEKLVGTPLQGVKLAYIPTAANVEPGDKSWVVKNLNDYLDAGFEVDIVDISALSKDIWLPRLQSAQVLFFGGGNTAHLMHWIKQSGLEAELPELLKTRIYAGISAGSCVAGPTIANAAQDLFGEANEPGIHEGLGLVDFHYIPHLNSPHFIKIREENLREAAKSIAEPLYALDDVTALASTDGVVEVVGGGEFLLL